MEISNQIEKSSPDFDQDYEIISSDNSSDEITKNETVEVMSDKSDNKPFIDQTISTSGNTIKSSTDMNWAIQNLTKLLSTLRSSGDEDSNLVRMIEKVLKQPNLTPTSIVLPSSSDDTWSTILREQAKCSICQKLFCNVYFLRYHMRNKHPEIIEETLEYISDNDLKIQQKSTQITPKVDHVIAAQPLNSGIKNDDHQHHEVPTTESTFATCSMCSKTFKNDEYLQKHIKRKHSPAEKHEISTQDSCQTASDKNLTTLPSDLATYTSTVDDNTCGACQKSFCCKYNLEHHVQDDHRSLLLPTTDFIKSTLTSKPIDTIEQKHVEEAKETEIISEDKINDLCKKSEKCLQISESTLESLKKALPSSIETTDDRDQSLTTKSSLNRSHREDDLTTTAKVNKNDFYCQICQMYIPNEYYFQKHQFTTHGIAANDRIKTLHEKTFGTAKKCQSQRSDNGPLTRSQIQKSTHLSDAQVTVAHSPVLAPSLQYTHENFANRFCFLANKNFQTFPKEDIESVQTSTVCGEKPNCVTELPATLLIPAGANSNLLLRLALRRRQ